MAFALQLLDGERTIYSSPVESRTAAIAIADDLRQRVHEWTELNTSPAVSQTGGATGN